MDPQPASPADAASDRDQRLEELLGNLLRVGVTLAAAVVLVGGVL